MENDWLKWLADFFTVLVGVSAVFGTVGKYLVLPWLDRRISEALDSMQMQMSDFAGTTAKVTEIISDLETAKKMLAGLNPTLDQQRQELEEKINALRKELRRTQGALLEAAANIAQDALKE